ncbi:AraC family transcriptional regulator [Arthrobacter sp. D1-29]
MRATGVSAADASAEALGRFAIQSKIPDEALDIGGKVYYPHHLDMGRSAEDFQWRTKGITLEGVTLGLLEYGTPMKISTGDLETSYQVNFPRFGRMKFSQGSSVVLGSPSLAAIHGPVGPTTLQGWSEPTQLLGLKIPTSLMHQELEALLGRSAEKELAFEGSFDLTSHRGKEWRAAVELLIAGVSNPDSLLSSPLMAHAAVQYAVRGLLLSAPNNFSEELAGDAEAVGSAAVRRAIDFMESNAHLPITLEALAADAFVSPRALQLGFRKHLDTTPMDHLRSIRLRRVRSELLSARPSTRVGDVAARWGFPHAGRFAIHYAKTFGEAPSQTLKKSTEPTAS